MKIKGVIAALGSTLLMVCASGSAQAAFPGDNGPIAFDNFDGGASRVYVVDTDGSGLTPLTSVVTGVSNYDPAFSPDSGQVAYTRHTDGSEEPGLGTTQIHLVDVDGANDVRITNGSGNHEMPSFSPDGGTIVFSEPGVGADAISTIGTDGTGRTQLISGTFALYPAFSPDGTQIAYFGSGGLTLMDADGTGSHVIAENALAGHGRPSFSPDGSRIAFGSMATEVGETTLGAGIHSVETDGTDRRVEVPVSLPNQPAFPAYSPDGGSLARSNEVLDFWAPSSPRNIDIGDLPLTTTVTVPLSLSNIEQIDWGVALPEEPGCETDPELCEPIESTPPAECEASFTQERVFISKTKPVVGLVAKYRSKAAGKVKISFYARKADGSKGKRLGKLTRKFSKNGNRLRVSKKVGKKRIKQLRRSGNGLGADFKVKTTQSPDCAG